VYIFLEELLAYHPSLQDPVLSDSNVTVNSKVCAAAMLLLLTVENKEVLRRTNMPTFRT
jgi:hypothetical protein